jgi:hypothetical protein
MFKQDGPRLPHELIAHIAQLLKDDIDISGFSYVLGTLARLNRVSKAVHAITLPYLYHRTVYSSRSSFLRSGRPKSIPGGWKYTKSVHILRRPK